MRRSAFLTCWWDRLKTFFFFFSSGVTNSIAKDFACCLLILFVTKTQRCSSFSFYTPLHAYKWVFFGNQTEQHTIAKAILTMVLVSPTVCWKRNWLTHASIRSPELLTRYRLDGGNFIPHLLGKSVILTLVVWTTWKKKISHGKAYWM